MRHEKRLRFDQMDEAIPPDPPITQDEESSEGKTVDEKSSGMKPGFEGGVSNQGKVDQSWARVAKDKKTLRKYDVEVITKEGKQMVEISDEVITDSTPLWKDFVIGKFLDLAPHVAKVHMVLNKIWKYGDLAAKIEVYEVNPTTMRFKISDQKAREKILKRGMWNIVGVPMIVTKWSPKAEEEKQEEESIPMWIHITKVPLHMFSWEGLSLIASPVGFPMKLHPETLACSSFEVAKVFVKADFLKALPKEMHFEKNGKEFMVEFHYPWLPSRCAFCNKWGHNEKVCSQKKKGKEKEGAPGSKSNGHDEERGLEKGKQEKINDKKEDGLVEVALTQESEMNLANKESSGNAESEENWSHVSPGKIGRSQTNTPIKNDVIISASKYTALSGNVEEEGETVDEARDYDIEDVDEFDIGENMVVLNESMEDSMLERSKSKERSVQKRGRKRGQKSKAQEVNPKSKRSSRLKN